MRPPTAVRSPTVRTSYPYYFYDANDNGVADAGEGNYTGRWTPRLMRAAHNYHMTQKEPGYWSHNTNYTAQLLIDSNENLGGDVSNFDRRSVLDRA